MANDTKFTHISVTIDDDDDFVIEAGSPAVAVVEPEPVAAAPEVVQPEPEPVAAPAVEPEPVSVPATAAAPEPAPAVEPVAAAPKPAVNEYRGTTLEDLEGGKMPGMQKGVIAVAVVAIIAFIVYLVL